MKENNAMAANQNQMGKVNSDARPYAIQHKSEFSQNIIYNNLQEVGQGIAEPSFGE